MPPRPDSPLGAEASEQATESDAGSHGANDENRQFRVCHVVHSSPGALIEVGVIALCAVLGSFVA